MLMLERKEVNSTALDVMTKWESPSVALAGIAKSESESKNLVFDLNSCHP